MRAYMRYFSLTIQSQMQFRINFILSFFTGFIFDYVKVAIWFAVMMLQVDRLHPSIIENTIKYMVLSSSFSLLYKSFAEGVLSGKIINGTIERELLYPVSVIGLHFSSGMGTMIINFFRTSCVTFILLTFMYSLSWQFRLIPFLGMLVLLFLGLVIQYLIVTLIDLSAFWLEKTRAVHDCWDAAYKFLGGFLMPLWFFPDSLQKIFNFLPFQNMVSIPVSVFIMQQNISQIGGYILQSSIWIIALFTLVKVVWYVGIKKLKINGG